MLLVPRHLASKVHTHPSINCLVDSVLRLQHEIRILQATNAWEIWQKGYKSVCFVAQQFSPLGNIVIEYIMAYGSTVVGMASKKMAAALKDPLEMSALD